MITTSIYFTTSRTQNTRLIQFRRRALPWSRETITDVAKTSMREIVVATEEQGRREIVDEKEMLGTELIHPVAAYLRVAT